MKKNQASSEATIQARAQQVVERLVGENDDSLPSRSPASAPPSELDIDLDIETPGDDAVEERTELNIAQDLLALVGDCEGSECPDIRAQVRDLALELQALHGGDDVDTQVDLSVPGEDDLPLPPSGSPAE